MAGPSAGLLQGLSNSSSIAMGEELLAINTSTACSCLVLKQYALTTYACMQLTPLTPPNPQVCLATLPPGGCWMRLAAIQLCSGSWLCSTPLQPACGLCALPLTLYRMLEQVASPTLSMLAPYTRAHTTDSFLCNAVVRALSARALCCAPARARAARGAANERGGAWSAGAGASREWATARQGDHPAPMHCAPGMQAGAAQGVCV